MTTNNKRRKTGKKSSKTSMTLSPMDNQLAKFLDTTFGASAVSDTAQLVNLGSVTLGSAITNRLRNEIFLQKLELHFTLTASDTDGFNTFRFMIVKALSPTAVIGDLPTNLTEVIDTRRFKIIWDKLYPVHGFSSGYLGPISIEKTFMIRDKVKFFGSTSTDWILGRYMFVYMSDSSAIPHPYITGFMRQTFYDV